MLKFAKGNAKLGKHILTFSLPSGFTCPGANKCLSKADRETGKITDGPENKFRCFSATQENIFKNVRLARWHNFDTIKQLLKEGVNATSDAILASIPEKTTHVRIHVAGDFFSQAYFDSWLMCAMKRQKTVFYFYTKSLKFWLARKKLVGDGFTPGAVPNFVPTASRGGRYDDSIIIRSLREARVVYSEDDAKVADLEIDHDDTHAMHHGKDFALLIHGVQPAGSEASKALQKLKKTFTGYGDGKLSLKVI